MTLLVLSVVGSDRPGLTRALAAAVLSAGGNWLESHLSRLGGLYVGSVLVDLAVERGGNVEGSEAGKTVTTANGVMIVGHLNVPGRIAASSSSLYAKNLFAFVETMIDKKEKTLKPNWDDELVKATLLTRDGAVVHPNFQPKA